MVTARLFSSNVSDPIADLLTRIRNANLAYKDELIAPVSRLNDAVLRILLQEGYIESFDREGEDVEQAFRIRLKYGKGRQRTITGQRPIVTKARKSIAGFKLREGMSIGAKVTLRGDRMWEFLDRLLSLALPRIRDFRGLSPSAFDGHGNFTLGVTEQLIFPEIDYDKVVQVRGMDITIVTTAGTDDEGRALLVALGFPFAGEPAVAQAS